jgi:hypothetical protein
VYDYSEDGNIISENCITGQEWLSLSGEKTISKEKSIEIQFNKVFSLDNNINNGNSPNRSSEQAHSIDQMNLHRSYFLSVVHSMSVLLKWEQNGSMIIELFTTKFPILLIEVIRSAISKMEECIVSWSDLAKINIIADYNKSMDLCCNDAHFIVSFLVGLIQLCSYSLPYKNEEFGVLNSYILPDQPWSIDCCQYLGFDLLKSHDTFNIPLSKPSLFNLKKSSTTTASRVGISIESALSSNGIVTILLNLISKISHIFIILQQLSTSSTSSSINPKIIYNIGSTRKKCFILQCEITHCLSKYFQIHPKISLQNFSSCNGSRILRSLIYKESSNVAVLPDIPNSNTITSLGITDKEIDIIFIRGINCLKLNNLILKSINSADYTRQIYDNYLLIINSIGPILSWLLKINLEFNVSDDLSFSCLTYNQVIFKDFQTDLYPWTTEKISPPSEFNPFEKSTNLFDISVTNRAKYYERQRNTIAKERKQLTHGKKYENLFDKRKYYLLAILDDLDSRNRSGNNVIESDKKELFRGKYSHMCRELFEELLKSIALPSIIKLKYPIELSSSSRSKALSRSLEGEIIASVLRQMSMSFNSIKKFSYEKPAMQTYYIIFLVKILRDYKDDTIGILFEPFNHNGKSSNNSQIVVSILFTCPLFFRYGLTHNPNLLIQSGTSKIHATTNPTDKTSTYEVKWNKTNSQVNDNEIDATRPHLLSNDSNDSNNMDLSAFDIESLSEIGSISRHSSPPLEGDQHELLISRSSSSNFTNDLDSINIEIQSIAASYFLLHDISFDFLWIVFTILVKEHAFQKIISTISSLLKLLTGEISDDVILQVSVFLSKIWDYLILENVILPPECWIEFFNQSGLICDDLSTSSSKVISKSSKEDKKTNAYKQKERPFYNPAKIAVVQLMVKVMKSWIFDISLIKSKDLKNWIERLMHSKLILEKRYRNAALFMVTKIMTSTSNNYDFILDKILATPVEIKDNDNVIKPKLVNTVQHEVLIHEILRYLIKIVKHSSEFEAVVDVLHSLSSFLRNKSCSLLAKHCLFDRYSKSTKENLYQSDIFTDMLVSLKYSLQKDRSWSSQQKSTLLRYTFTFFTSLMIDYDVYKETFRQFLLQRVKLEGLSSLSLASKNCNYHDITSFISEVERCPSFETSLVLFEMLFDGLSNNFPNPLSLLASNVVPRDGLISSKGIVPVMVNLSCIPVIITMVKYCEESVQLFILNTFQSLISGNNSVVNLSKCLNMQPSMIDLILDFFPYVSPTVQKKSVKLLQTIGKHSISVAQLKRFFRLMQIKGEFRPSYTWMLLDALNGINISFYNNCFLIDYIINLLFIY